MKFSLPASLVEWLPCWRLVSSRFPPQSLFDRVAQPEDLDIIFYIEGLTNPRLRDELGQITQVLPEDRISGPGTSPIMAAFTHLNPSGSRFSDGSFGIYYAAKQLETAIAETQFHRERFLAATQEPAMEIDMRSYAADLTATLHDIRSDSGEFTNFYAPDPADYAAAQQLGIALREQGSNGIVYHSVRHPSGECIAVFRPRLLSPVRQGPHFCYVWNGKKISQVYEKRSLNLN